MKDAQAAVCQHARTLGQLVVDGQGGQQGSFGGFEGVVLESLFEFTLAPLAFLLLVFLLAALVFFFVFLSSLEMLVLGFVLVGRNAQNNTRNGHFEFYCGTRLTFSLILGLDHRGKSEPRVLMRET